MLKYTLHCICRSQKFIPHSFVCQRRCFQNTSFCGLRVPAKEFLRGKFMAHSVDRAYPPVYVVSRIEGLLLAIRNLSEEICHGLNVKEIEVPVDTDILNPSSIKELKDANVVVIDPKLLANNYKNMPKLEWAHCTWAGVEPLFEIMNEKPHFILTRHAEDEFSEQMAEYVMAQILILEKNFRSIWVAQSEKSWSQIKKCVDDSARNRRLKDLTLSILGVGNMGQAIAKFFKPHGTRVIGFSRRERKSNEFGIFDKIDVSLSEVLASADYIVNTLPSTSETVGLLNGNVLKSCIKMPVFINVGRGNIINDDTLFKAFESNWLSHAVLDVFQQEPLPVDSKLWDSKHQITITPHCSAISQPKYVAKDFLCSFLTYLQKSPLKNVVNWEKGY